MDRVRRRNENITNDGYLYVTRRTTNNIRYLICKNFKITGCTASGKIPLNGNDDEFIGMNKNHNHPQVQSKIETVAFKRSLKEACIRHRGNLKDIYNRVALRHAVGALNAPYNSLRSSMLRWRQSTTPNVPGSLEELGNTLESGEWARYSYCSTGLFYSGAVSRDGFFAVLFGNREFLEHFQESQNTFIDGTFKAVPRQPHFAQILTIFATCMDHAFPVVHVFMQRRTKALYDAVFEYVSTNFPHFMNGTVVTDYETALVESLRASFPDASLQGCFFHYCQSVFRKAKRLGIVREIEGNPNGRNLLRKYYALALLPADIIVPALESLGENLEFLDTFRGLNNYIRRQWVDRVTPQHFSVFRATHRTNNVMESYHRRLNSKLVRHPGVWNLIETLIDIQNTAIIEFEQLTRGHRVFRTANKDVVFDERLNRAWDKLSVGRLSVEEFFRQAAHFVEGLDLELNDWEAATIDEDGDELDLPNFQTQPPQILIDPVPVHNPSLRIPPISPPPLVPIHGIPILRTINEPPPLIYFHNGRPITPLNEHLFAADVFEQDERQPSPIPPTLEHEERQQTSPVLPIPLSPSPPAQIFNIPPISGDIGPLFAALRNDEIPAFQNYVQLRWDPTIAVTDFDDTMPEVLRCNVCLLNKIQYSLECGHVFCTACADTLFNEQARCGICRADLTRNPAPLYLN